MTVIEAPPKPTTAPDRTAELLLLFATAVWGSSFTWAKAGGDTINRISGAGAGAMLGPAMLMGARFVLSGIIWLIVFPQARRGWSWASAGRGLTLGVLMGSGLVLQVLGLDRTSEAVSAFLTSLTILWVPTIMTLWIGKPPPGIFWIGVAMAGAGIWLMTGTTPAGFGAGELLGLACSVAFSFHLILINVLIPRDNPDRMNGAQMLVAGLCGIGLCLFTAAGRSAWQPASAVRILSDSTVAWNLVLLILFPTVISFGIMAHFQPRVDASRATLIYLLEPVFAGAYAWLLAGKAMGAMDLLGAALILGANMMVEVLSARGRGKPPPG